MTIREIQSKCQEVQTYAKYRDRKAASSHEHELRERFIEHVAAVGGTVLSFKAQMVLSTRKLPFKRFDA